MYDMKYLLKYTDFKLNENKSIGALDDNTLSLRKGVFTPFILDYFDKLSISSRKIKLKKLSEKYDQLLKDTYNSYVKNVKNVKRDLDVNNYVTDNNDLNILENSIKNEIRTTYLKKYSKDIDSLLEDAQKRYDILKNDITASPERDEVIKLYKERIEKLKSLKNDKNIFKTEIVDIDINESKIAKNWTPEDKNNVTKYINVHKLDEIYKKVSIYLEPSEQEQKKER
jgi:hypothetical protein